MIAQQPQLKTTAVVYGHTIEWGTESGIDDSVPPDPFVHFYLNDDDWADEWAKIDQGLLIAIAEHVFQKTKWARPCTVSLTYMTDHDIQQVNAEYRQQDKPTNVLSFPGYDDMLLDILPAGEPVPLGDIIFARETIQCEAQQQNKPLAHHFLHLFVHGLLHLLGYDHVEDAEAEHMEQLEIDILQHFLIPNPYEVTHTI